MSGKLAVRKETVSIQYTSMTGEHEAGGIFGDIQGPLVLFHYHIFLPFWLFVLMLPSQDQQKPDHGELVESRPELEARSMSVTTC